MCGLVQGCACLLPVRGVHGMHGRPLLLPAENGWRECQAGAQQLHACKGCWPARAVGWQLHLPVARRPLHWDPVTPVAQVYLRFGLPSLRPFPAAAAPWMQGVAQSTEFYHFLVATLLMQIPQLWVGMVPLALAAAPPALAGLGARFGGHPLWSRYGRPAKELLDRAQVGA